MSRLSRLFEPLFDWEGEMSSPVLFPEVRWPPLLRLGNECPDINVWEDGTSVYVEAELPGVSADALRIDVAGSELTIAGDRNASDTTGTSLRRERATAPFRRTISLPWEIAGEKVDAVLHDGVLTITMPRSERTRPRRIAVSAAAPQAASPETANG